MTIAASGTAVTAISATNTDSEPNVAVTTVLPAKAVTAPHLLVAFGTAENEDGATTLTFADSANGAHALIAPMLTSTFQIWLAMWAKNNALTNAATVGTMTEDVPNGYRRLIMAEFNGADLVAPFGDPVQVLDDFTASPTTVAGNITPQQIGNMILLGGVVLENHVHVTPHSGWTQIANVRPTTGVGLETFMHSIVAVSLDPIQVAFDYATAGDHYSATAIEIRAPYVPPILPPTVSTTLGSGLGSRRGFQGKTGLKPGPFRHGTVR